jgi:hypothetical protein
MEEQLDKLAFSFFKLFAQYESYLKKHKYFQITNGGKINVDWDRFVNERIGQDYINKLGGNAASAEYILSAPPKKQVVNPEGVIVCGEVSNDERSVQILFGHISRIRNNLYHGAKFNGTWFDPERSEQLLLHGLTVLEHFKGLANVH